MHPMKSVGHPYYSIQSRISAISDQRNNLTFYNDGQLHSSHSFILFFEVGIMDRVILFFLLGIPSDFMDWHLYFYDFAFCLMTLIFPPFGSGV
jgi:hypothetical protein